MHTSDSSIARIGETEFLPSYAFYEIHSSEPIQAEPVEIIEAVASFDMSDDKVVDVMVRLRDLPSRLRTKPSKIAEAESTSKFGFNTFTLLRRSDHELSMGLVGRFWKPMLDIRDIANATEFQAFDDPTQAKLVLRFLVEESERQSPRLVTETFIHCPSRGTKLLFTPYWLAIRLVSGWLRKRTLKSIRQKLIVPR